MFDFLACPVADVERWAEFASRHGRASVTAQGFLRRFQTTGGIESRGELEGNLMGAKQGRGLRNLLQSHQAGALSGAQAFQTNRCQNAIFASQGDHIRNGSQGDQIQQGTQVEVSRAEDTGFAGALKQSVGEFEGEPNGAELCKGARRILGFAGIAGRGKPWIDQSNGAGAGTEIW